MAPGIGRSWTGPLALEFQLQEQIRCSALTVYHVRLALTLPNT